MLCSDLVAKTHTIVLIDYGRKMVVPFVDVRELSKDIDQNLLINFSQKSTMNTFFLSGYISKPKSNNELVNILCNKYYKYRRDFDINDISFITLYDVDQKLIDNGIATTIDITTMITIANSMSSLITLNNTNDVINKCFLPNKVSALSYFLKSQRLDCINLIDVYITRVSIDNHTILLTVRTLVSINIHVFFPEVSTKYFLT